MPATLWMTCSARTIGSPRTPSDSGPEIAPQRWTAAPCGWISGGTPLLAGDHLDISFGDTLDLRTYPPSAEPASDEQMAEQRLIP